MSTQLFVNQYNWQVFLNKNAMRTRSVDYWQNIENGLTAANITFECHYASTFEEDIASIQVCYRKGHRHFIVVGGDGTLNFFIDALMNTGVEIKDVYLALIPLGTGNDWARSHHYPSTIDEVLKMFLRGRFIPHDVGRVEISTPKEKKIRHFINIAGFGFDAEVIQNTKSKSARFLENYVYIVTLLKTLFSYKSKKVHFEIDDVEFVRDSFTIAVGLNQFNGNGMRQCPNAQCNSGFFDVVVIQKVGFFKVLRNVGRLFKGTHVGCMKEVENWQAKRVRMVSSSKFLGEVEGEMLPQGDYTLTNLPQTIYVLSEL